VQNIIAYAVWRVTLGLVICLRLRYKSLFSAEISAAPFMTELRREEMQSVGSI
jgi:hypothetical protein